MRFEELSIGITSDSIGKSISTGLRILGNRGREEATYRAYEAWELVPGNHKEALTRYIWSELLDRFRNYCSQAAIPVSSNNDSDEDDENEPVPAVKAPMEFTLTVTLDDEATLALQTLQTRAGANSNAEIIGTALKFYSAALKHHQEQLDELNEDYEEMQR